MSNNFFAEVVANAEAQYYTACMRARSKPTPWNLMMCDTAASSVIRARCLDQLFGVEFSIRTEQSPNPAAYQPRPNLVFHTA